MACLRNKLRSVCHFWSCTQVLYFVLLLKRSLVSPILLFSCSFIHCSLKSIPFWVSFLLWPSCFIHSGTLSSSRLLFPSSMLDTFRPGGLIFWCHIFFFIYTVHEVLMANILGWFTIPFPVDHILPEVPAMTCPSWVALLWPVHLG